MSTSRHLDLNQKLWESWTRVNVRSDFYDVEGFKRGDDPLDEVVLNGVGDVRGKSLLHLQCHFGLDTLSWARRGADVVGVDFSQEAVSFARDLAREIDIDARFIQCNIYELSEHLNEQFDVVFTSHVVLGWLPDIRGWAETIARHLKSGGTFFIAEIHPVAWMFDEARTDKTLAVEIPYFHRDEPLMFVEKGSYADPDADIENKAYYWSHPLSDIIGSLLGAGLTLQSFEEYPFLEWQQFAWMEQNEKKSWMLPADVVEIPLMFSLRATKPAVDPSPVIAPDRLHVSSKDD